MEIIFILEKRFFAPVKTMLASMRVLSNMNSNTQWFKPKSICEAVVRVQGWMNNVTSRIDLVPSANNQLFLSAGKPEVTVVILSSRVASIELSFAIDLNPEILIVKRFQVAGENVRSMNEDRSRHIILRHCYEVARVIKVSG